MDAGTVKTLFTDATHLGLIDATGTSSIDDATISNAGTLEATAGTLTLDHDTITNSGLIEATTGGKIVLSNTAATLNNAGGTITVDGSSAPATTTAGILTLAGATISGGTINNYSLDASNNNAILPGTINVAGASTLQGVSSSSKLQLNKGTLSVGASLTLNNVIISASQLSQASGGSGSIEIDNTVQLTAAAAIIGLITVTNNGTLEIKGGSAPNTDATLNNVSLGNSAGTLQIDDGSALVLTGGSSITGGTINDYTPSAGTGGTIHVTGNAGLFGVSGSNLLQLYNGNVTVDSAATFTLDDVSVSATSFSDSGTLQVGSTHKLTLSSVTATGGASRMPVLSPEPGRSTAQRSSIPVPSPPLAARCRSSPISPGAAAFFRSQPERRCSSTARRRSRSTSWAAPIRLCSMTPPEAALAVR